MNYRNFQRTEDGGAVQDCEETMVDLKLCLRKAGLLLPVLHMTQHKGFLDDVGKLVTAAFWMVVDDWVIGAFSFVC